MLMNIWIEQTVDTGFCSGSGRGLSFIRRAFFLLQLFKGLSN